MVKNKENAPPQTEEDRESQIALRLKDIREKKPINKGGVILVISGAIAGILMVMAILNGMDILNIAIRPGLDTTNRALDFGVLAFLALVGPFGFYSQGQATRIRQIEERLPDFLRDVAEAGRFGMTLADAIVVASSGRYGKLTDEIKTMASQIEWGVPATEALRLFAQRVDTPMVNRVVAIVVKASDAGGNVADVLSMVSHDVRENLHTANTKLIAMSSYVAVISISFFVFVATILILQVTFLPQIEKAGKGVSKVAESSGLSADSGAVTLAIEAIPEIKLAYFVAIIAHAIGDGIMCGVLQTGKIANGLRYAFLLLLIGWLMLRMLG